MDNYVPLVLRPIELRDANAFIGMTHRHHRPVQGHRFSICVRDNLGVVRGVATIGRPVARNAGNPLDVLEITRVATDGTRNACSMLYGAAARIGKAMGYRRIQTYTLADEPGTSLRAAGYVDEGIMRTARDRLANTWIHSDGRERRQDQHTGAKRRWGKAL